ncbi:MAG: radical SAM protein [Candidatus Firestonebacteria bacterium]
MSKKIPLTNINTKDEINLCFANKSADVSFAIGFPESYYIGMSNLGWQVIYAILNARKDVICERFFLNDNSKICTVENRNSLKDFDFVGFSLSFELNYINVLKILKLAKIPLLSNERKYNDPIIIAGGVCASYNPEPLANFIDVFVIGDSEEVISEIIDKYKKIKADSRDKILLELANIPGVYVPKFYTPIYNSDNTIKKFEIEHNVPKTIKRRIVQNLDICPGMSAILTPNTEFGKMLLVEINRGCSRMCKFCVTSFIQTPVRRRSLACVMDIIEKGLKWTNKIGLVGTSITDYPEIDELVTFIIKKNAYLSTSSLRAEGASDILIEALGKGGQKTFTIAVETMSEKLQKIIKKEIKEETIYSVVSKAIKNDIINIKLYFMIGLPEENMQDIDINIRFIKRLVKYFIETSVSTGRIGKIIAGFSVFIPKPFTPFESEQMENIKNLKQKMQYLKGEVTGIPNLELRCESLHNAVLQGVFSRGDRRVGGILDYAVNSGVDLKTSLKNLTKSDIDFHIYGNSKGSGILPWKHLNS